MLWSLWQPPNAPLDRCRRLPNSIPSQGDTQWVHLTRYMHSNTPDAPISIVTVSYVVKYGKLSGVGLSALPPTHEMVSCGVWEA